MDGLLIQGLNNYLYYFCWGGPYYNYSIMGPPNPYIRIMKAPILNPHNSPYSSPYKPLEGNPILILKAPIKCTCKPCFIEMALASFLSTFTGLLVGICILGVRV